MFVSCCLFLLQCSCLYIAASELETFLCEFLIYYILFVLIFFINIFSISTSSPSCTPVLVQSKAKEMSGVSSISLGNCDSVFSSVRLNHLPLEEQWGGPYPGPKSNLNPQRLLKLLQAISKQTHVKSTQTTQHTFCCCF